MSCARISDRWRRMAEIYRSFSEGRPNLDFSEEAAAEMFVWESRGEGNLALGLFNPRQDGRYNGYAVGKHWMDATVAMWRQDLRDGLLLYSDLKQEFPEWFLARVLRGWWRLNSLREAS